jgi:hypothetical protein
MDRHVPGRLARLLAALALAGVGGCGGTATLSGKLSHKGRPVRYGSVIVVSADRTARSAAIEPDGSYSVADISPGPVKLAVISRDPSKARTRPKPGRPTAPGKEETDKAVAGWFELPRLYEDPEKSGIHATLGSGRVTWDIDLP